MRPHRLDAHLGAEMPEHALGVIPGRRGLDHHSLPRRRKPREQHRGFELGGGDRRLVDDRDRVERAPQGQRQPPALADREDLRAHAFQRIEHAPHRALAQGGVAVEGRRDRRTRNRAEQQPAAGAGIAEIERRPRRRKARNSDAVNAPAALAGALDAGAERAHGVRGAHHVLAFEQAGNARLADRERGENQGAMRDRLVARHADAALERRAGARAERG